MCELVFGLKCVRDVLCMCVVCAWDCLLLCVCVLFCGLCVYQCLL